MHHMTVVSMYVRISEEDRTRAIDRGAEWAVKNQRSDLEAFVVSMGHEVGPCFIDNDISATSGVRRPGFEALLTSKPQAIAVWHTDRLVRVNKDLERVIDLGVNVYAKTAGHLDLSTPAGRAVARTITAWAQYEGEQKALRQRLSNAARARSGRSWWASRPYGNEMDGYLNAEEAAVVQGVADDFLAGASLRSIAQALNTRGVTTNRGNAWTGAGLQQLLRNPRLAGIRMYDGEEVGKGDWTPVLEEAKWRTAKAILDRPERRNGTKREGRKYLLTGIAKCGECGGDIGTQRRRATATNRVKDDYVLYACRINYCASKPVELVDYEVEQSVLALIRRERMQQRPERPFEGSVDVLLTEAQTLRERLREAAQGFSEGVIDMAQLGAISGTLRSRLEAIEQEVAQREEAPTVTRLLIGEDLDQQWGLLGLDQRRRVIDSFVTVRIMRQGKGYRPSPESIVVERRPRGGTALAPQR